MEARLLKNKETRIKVAEDLGQHSQDQMKPTYHKSHVPLSQSQAMILQIPIINHWNSSPLTSNLQPSPVAERYGLNISLLQLLNFLKVKQTTSKEKLLPAFKSL